MKKKKRMRRIKSWLKNTILIGITIFAMLIFICSVIALLEAQVKAMLCLVLSATWLVVFGMAN